MFMGNISAHAELQTSIANLLEDHRSLALNDTDWCRKQVDLPLAERREVPGCGCDACRLAEKLGRLL
jgi:hypothetical protein